ncbi:cyclic nucleotide-gated ion channel 1-like [Juglans microcarpa x Juglans regia]|uniref:cyclic nucleotide-gated ion channel 1-like n=1 Tax=Juglans microcarpa x Juglans regia TaxID=2249226 RepID=UPI001B7EDF4E|nr:cyclic nucleotide-gated ion channel 1-like [Juglans microcarpa x Juglans regia]
MYVDSARLKSSFLLLFSHSISWSARTHKSIYQFFQVAELIHRVRVHSRMRYHKHRPEKEVGDPDIEGQIHSGTVQKWIVNILHPEGEFLRIWKLIFLVSCVFSVSVDPLFFYLPVINDEKKCVALDRRLHVISICLRSVLDSISLGNIILQCCCPYIDENARPHEGQDGVLVTDAWPIAKRYLWSPSFVIDVLSILPIPQMVVPIIFSEMRGSNGLNTRKVLNAVVLSQYVPRITRIYLSWRKFRKNTTLPVITIAVKAGFNLFLYIVASHILGGLWYFFSVERETACWHLACESHSDKCVPSSFACNHGSFGNYTFLNDSCPIETPNTTVFDFGIFQGALQSGTVASMDFPRKILYCFWWGLRNLSSFGSNLQTSTHFWENGFAVLTSVSGLLLFMCFLGHLQMYMQWEASRQLEEANQVEEYGRWRQYEMEAKKGKTHAWIVRNPRLKEIGKQIMSQVDRMFAENKDIDAENPLPYLPIFTRRDILRRLCLPLLRKVPLLQNESEDVLKLISSDFLKQVYYNENSYIAREGEPLDALLFITQGIVWTYTTSPDNRQTGFITTDDFYGVELLEWVFKSPFVPDPSNLPFSTRTLRCHTKVEAFALTVGNIQHMLYKYWWKFSNIRGISDSNLVENFAASNVQAAFRRWQHARQMMIHGESGQKTKKTASAEDNTT